MSHDVEHKSSKMEIQYKGRGGEAEEDEDPKYKFFL